MTSASLFLRPNLENEAPEVIRNLFSWMTRKKVKIFLEERLKTAIGPLTVAHGDFFEFTEDPQKLYAPDLIITLGGDGTLLGVCRNITPQSPPIFGINLGRLGFITEFSRHEFFDELGRVLSGKMSKTSLCLYRAQVWKKKALQGQSLFVNDAVFTRNDISRMMTLAVEAKSDSKKELIYDLSGDGLIVSSPIGSTAYSLAAGGPVIGPDIPALGLTPICPHGLTCRPLVISDAQEIVVKCPEKLENIRLTLDGQVCFPIHADEHVVIRKRDDLKAHLVKNPRRTYLGALREKFTYGNKA